MKSKEEEKDLVSGTFTWKINDFSKLKDYKVYSQDFIIAGLKWYAFHLLALIYLVFVD